MLEATILSLIAFLLVMLVIYIWASQRNLAKARPLTPQEYLWKLKQITGKSEYDIFQIAAKEKGWGDDWVENHFRRYLEDQSLPIYVQQFIEDGRAHIGAYRPMLGSIFNKKGIIFFSIFSILVIGGSLFFCLYIYPRVYPFPTADGKPVPRFVRPIYFKAISLADRGQYDKACIELKRACELGECEYYEKYCLTTSAGSNENND
jgi:hypothetical protein